MKNALWLICFPWQMFTFWCIILCLGFLCFTCSCFLAALRLPYSCFDPRVNQAFFMLVQILHSPVSSLALSAYNCTFKRLHVSPALTPVSTRLCFSWIQRLH